MGFYHFMEKLYLNGPIMHSNITNSFNCFEQSPNSRYGNVTEADKLPDKPIGFVHMEDQEVHKIEITL